MALIPIPTSPNFVSTRWTARHVKGLSESRFTLDQQVQPHFGERWEFIGTLPPMARADAEEWIAFLLRLEGPDNTFLMGDSVGATPRGVATVDPGPNALTRGVQTLRSHTLQTDGWTASQTGILKAGDYIQISNQLVRVRQDANSNGSGEADFDIWPSLQQAYSDNLALTVNSAKGEWRLATSQSDWDINRASHFGITFAAIEKRTFL